MAVTMPVPMSTYEMPSAKPAANKSSAAPALERQSHASAKGSISACSSATLSIGASVTFFLSAP